VSARIDEYHGADAKPWTTKEVEKWQFVLGPTMPLRRSLATTRALEDAERKRDEFKVASQEKAGWLLDALARAEKAERERDEFRTTIADLVTALEVLERFAGKVGRDDLCERARDALAKAKATKP
jgi:hypothetical protein